ncbi:MAG: SDR family oxidoreductase [Nanoarchaeota archaeon]
MKNKVVVITGASSGIGKAAAIEFAEKGAKVVLAARRLEKLQELHNFISTFNKNCMPIRTDVTQEKDVINLFKETEKKFGRVDILINNVGKGLKSKFHLISCDEWISTIHTNLTNVFLCTKQASKMMMREKIKGHIITISSLAGLFNIPGYSGYCCTKHAVTSFKSSIKWELRQHGIKVSTIHPYKVDTEFFDAYNKKPNRAEMLSPKDVAHFLVAIAERNILKITYVRIINIFKRIYYLIRHTIF